MPAMFAFAFTSENRLIDRMHEVAEETEHAIKTVEWAEHRHKESAEDVRLHDLYREAVLKNVRLVEGSELQLHHKAANYVQANPFKCIAGIGIPSVAYIFYGEGATKPHQSLQLQILHTRVFGQFAVICTLLGVMGLKEMMDRRYVIRKEGMGLEFIFLTICFALFAIVVDDTLPIRK